MQHPKASIAAFACAIVIAGCTTKSLEGRGTTASAERDVSADDSGAPQKCPGDMPPLCIIGNIDLSSGAPRVENGCTPLIHVDFDAGQTSFTWSSPAGQLIDAVLVRSGTSNNSYAYNPAVSGDSEPLAAPTHAQLTQITFCGTLGARADAGTEAGTDAGADAPPEPPANDGGKTW